MIDFIPETQPAGIDFQPDANVRAQKRQTMQAEMAQLQQARKGTDRLAAVLDVVEPLAEGAKIGASFSPSQIVGQAERGVEAAATLATGEQRELPVKLGPTLAQPLYSIPQLEPGTNAPVATQVGAGLANAAIDLANMMQSPEGVAFLGLGSLPKQVQKTVTASMATTMASDYPEQLEQAYHAAKAGDYATATKAIVATPVMSTLLVKASVDKPALPRVNEVAKIDFQPEVDLKARNNAAPGTLRPQEQQAYAPPQAEAPAGMVKAEGPVFERQGFFKEPQNERQIRFEEPRPVEPEPGKLPTGEQDFRWATERKPDFLRTAEDKLAERRDPNMGVDVPEREASAPVKASDDLLTQKLDQLERLRRIRAMGEEPATTSRKQVDDLLGVGRKPVGLEVAEETLIKEIQALTLDKAGYKAPEPRPAPVEAPLTTDSLPAARALTEATRAETVPPTESLLDSQPLLASKNQPVSEAFSPDPLSSYIQTEPAMARARSIASKYAEQLGESAEDLAVEGISHVWQKVEAGAAKGVDAAKVENWTSMALKNYYLDQVRNKAGQRLRQAERFGEPEGDGIALEQRLADKGVGPEQAMQVSELTSILEQALPKLDNISRDLLQRRMVGEDVSLSEVARQNGITPEAVRQRWAKATKTLVEALDEAGYDGESFLAIKERMEKAKPSNGANGRLYGGIPFFDPALYRPLIQFGTSVAAKTGRQFASWSKAMTNLLGDKVVPYLKHVWNMIGRAGEDVLRKANLPDLADRLRKFEDRERANLAEWLTGYETLQQRYTRSEFKQAHREAEQYMRLRERGASSKQQLVTFRAEAMRYEQGMSRAGRALVKWMQETGIKTGDLSSRIGIEVQDGAAWRPMVNMGELHFPRNLSERTQEIIRDPEAKGNRAEYQQLLRDLVSNGNAKTIAEADAMVRRQFSTLIKGDHFGNAEKARGMKLPDRYYDYSVDNYLRFLRRFAKRSAQIEAFGQAKGEQFAPEFQKALDTTRDPRMQRYLGYLHNVVHDVRAETPGQRALDASRKVAAGAFLSGPVTAIRNFESSVRNSAETFGVTATSKALAATMKDSAVAMGKSVARAFKGDVRLAKPESVRVAQEIGAVQRDLKAATIMDLETTGEGLLDRVNRVALGVNGVAERLGRTVNAGAAMTWLRHTQELVKANGGINSTSYRVRARLATLKRLGYEGQALSDLMAGKQEVVHRYVRDAVREKQYGYTVSQAPLAFDTASGKFFLQFQKWGVQRVRDLHRNVIKPAFKGEMVNGKRTLDVMPLLRFSLLTVAGAEGLKLIAEGLFGRQSKTASNEELLATLSEDETRAVELTAERLIHDVVMEGGLGLIGDYYGIVQNATERGKFKSPINPPAFSFLNGLKDLVVDQVQRGGDLSALGRDVATYFRTYPLAAQAEGMVVNALEATGQGDDYTADRANSRDRSWVRSLVQRYAEETGLDANVSRNAFKAGKTEQTETYERLSEALSRGDEYMARQVIQEFAGEPGSKGYREALQKLKGSVRNRHVLDTFGVSTAQERKGFMEWAKRRVPSKAGDIQDMVETYEETAKAVGLK